jgi:Tfp pilus assembly protein PilN
MIKINLVPVENIEQLDKRAIIAKSVLAGISVIVIVVVVSVVQITRAKNLESTLKVREAEFQSLQKEIESVKAIEGQIAEVEKYLGAINKITKNKLMYTVFMQDLMNNLPGTIWFSNLNTNSKENVLTLNITATSMSAYDLAYWINAVETNPNYSEMELGAISISETESGKTLGFPLKLKYTYK